ncbi:Gfo/Idh/MocA family protein [Niabella ginsengisoli]|uniref:Gfo/Idh/MocA family oxidoreductase n=1 Tax=Niabella ginsengisoli TaxID=522298 RepID=A0ABS9SK67_9BACT|nr:Gfo/Idh/MocA family oxidoreductase [Niabella ginsengisoli]MCH5598763.1 Gfo/Idh/MocA family oxidoreductase [Niabella ginsengisoli]
MINNNPDIPICIIGAGGIVADAHLPAYKIGGFEVKGIVNRNKQKATALAEKFKIAKVYDTIEEMVAENGTNVIYDFALPASEIIPVLEQLPEKATILIQKPYGESLEEAKAIHELAQSKQMLAGVNFQMRFAPYILEAKQMIKEEKLGAITDIEVYVNVHTPWNLWDFLFTKERMEINYHSIHYIDLIRSFLGTPEKLFARTFKHPQSMQLASVKSNIIMDYGDMVRATIHTNHNHEFGYQKQESYIKIEGEKGAIKITFGALIDYPHGVSDVFEYVLLEDKNPGWKQKDIDGTWFPHAFIGTMQQMMLAKAGIIEKPENSIDDALMTMACVEAAYASNQIGGILIDDFL